LQVCLATICSHSTFAITALPGCRRPYHTTDLHHSP
jgi:hypothetical protein